VALVASALAAKAAIDHFSLEGTLRVFGAPAEEQLISRPYHATVNHYFAGSRTFPH
jgi:hypothetical protein